MAMTGDAHVRVHAEVDHDLCVGHGGCRRIAGAAFRRTALGQSEFVVGSADSKDVIMDAAANCPVGAITVRIESTESR